MPRWASLITVLALGVSASANAAPPVAEREAFSLEDAIRLAQQQARAVVRARADLNIVDAQRARAVAAVLPSLDVLFIAQERFRNGPIIEFRGPVFCDSSLSSFEDCSSTNDFIEGPFTDRQQLNDASEPRFDLVIVAQQLLYDGGRWWEAIGQVDDRKRRYTALLEAVNNNIRLDVARSFYRYESARRARETFELRVALGEAQLRRARSLLEEGQGAAADVANAERNLAEDRVTLARRAFNEARQRRGLNLAMARPADAPLSLIIPHHIATATAPLSKTEVPTASAVKEAALAHRPDLRATRALVQEIRHNVGIQTARYAPRLSLDAAYRRGSRRPDRVFNDPSTNFIATLGLTLRWNLFEGGRTDALIREAEMGVVKIEADYADFERRVFSDALDRRENLQLQIQVYGLALDAIGSALDAVDLARELFETGKNTALALRDAELKYTNAQLGVINARLQVEVAREELLQATGVDLIGP